MSQLVEFKISCPACGSENAKINRSMEAIYICCSEKNCGVNSFSQELTDRYLELKLGHKKDVIHQRANL